MMIKKVLVIFTGCLFYSVNALADSQMFRHYRANNDSRDYRTNEGEYNEYLNRGYDIQPNRPGVWVQGCRTDDYYCMAQLEKTTFQATIDRTEPSVLQDHGPGHTTRSGSGMRSNNNHAHD
ncbi:MAG: hypothetical protein J0H47_02375 [Gammaproteobacteria bacterium]|nr:hypothetical protein [Gammaproteobacteria bacterium]